MNGFVDETFVIFNINLETDLLGIFFINSVLFIWWITHVILVSFMILCKKTTDKVMYIHNNGDVVCTIMNPIN